MTANEPPASPHRPWESTVDHGDDSLRETLRAHAPAFAELPILRLGSGWDNTAVRLGEDWMARFARRDVAAPLLALEAQVLPGIARALPLPIPEPVASGTQVGASALPFLVQRFLPGVTACSMDFPRAARERAGWTLGSCLSALHGMDPGPDSGEGLGALPRDGERRARRAERLDVLRERAGAVGAKRADLVPALARALGQLESLADAGDADRMVPVHGDLYARHIVLDRDARPTGLIDWGDVHVGDPALDLSIAFSLLPAGAARLEFFRGYGRELSQDEEARARFRALQYGVVLTWFGEDVGDPGLLRSGVDALVLGLQND